jgi:hypothetical protein
MKQLKLVKYTTKKYSPDEKQAIMVEAMRYGYGSKYCQAVINFGNQGKHAMGSLEDALPRILHLHKRFMEKIIEILLVKSFHQVNRGSQLSWFPTPILQAHIMRLHQYEVAPD